MPLTPDMLRTSQLAEQNARPVRVSGRERSYSEEIITPESALTSSAVISIITIMSQDIASIPLFLYARKGRAKFRAFDDPYYRLMHDQPNPEHTSMVFRELMMSHLIAWGNFYAQKIIDKSGNVVELWPLRPDRMAVKRVEGEKVYIYIDSSGKQRVFLQEEILHIPAFGFDGLIGYSRIALARHAIGLSVSLDKYGSKFFANGAHVDVVYKHPGTMTENAYNRLNDSLKEEHTGTEKAHKPIILEEGVTIDKLGLPNDDAQFLETKGFQLAEINRILGPVPPFRIADVERSTSWGSGIDSQEQGYINHTIFPYAVRIEQNLNTQILPESARVLGMFYEHLFDAYLRGDIATRYEAYVKAINNGIMSPNEVRVKENMNPYKDGDVYLRPLNMTPVNETPIENGTTASAFEPLWKDAIARVLKRESNDLLGASRRHLAKGQQAEFEKWADQFYTVDHPAFVRKQFTPILDVMNNFSGNASHVRLGAFMDELLDVRCALVKTLTAENIVDGMETYLARATEEILSFVSREFAVQRTVEPRDWLEDMEFVP